MVGGRGKEIDAEVLAGYVDPLPASVEVPGGSIRLAPIQEQADLAEEAGTVELYFCPDPWALRHRFASTRTGDMIRARCDRWECLHCGPRKTNQWRKLIAAAEPELHVVLSRAGNTVEEAARALTTWVQYLRRGSKGRGKSRVGARPAYPIEYFAVLERHANFEETGFHWHVLIKGVDYLPKEVLDASWESATHGKNKFAYVDRVKNARAVGYVTKYLTKQLAQGERGTKQKQREVNVLMRDEHGNRVWRKKQRTVIVESSARRIRYSRHFFPESVERLRRRLFARLEDPNQVAEDAGASSRGGTDAVVAEPAAGTPGESGDADGAGAGETVERETGPAAAPASESVSEWVLLEVKPYTDDWEEWDRWRRQALLESLMKVRAGEWFISGRVLSVWSFQRSQQQKKRLRLAG